MLGDEVGVEGNVFGGAFYFFFHPLIPTQKIGGRGSPNEKKHKLVRYEIGRAREKGREREVSSAVLIL